MEKRIFIEGAISPEQNATRGKNQVLFEKASKVLVSTDIAEEYKNSYSPVVHGPRNTRPEKPGRFLSVILRQTIIGGHGNRCQLHPKLASLCRFRATLNRHRSGFYRPLSSGEKANSPQSMVMI